MQRKSVTTIQRKPVKRRAEQPQRPLIAFLRRRAGAILGLLLVGVLVHDLFGDHGFLAMRRAQLEAEKIQQEIQQIHQENARLAGEVEALKTDPRMIERIAREELGLAREGEIIIKLPPKQK